MKTFYFFGDSITLGVNVLVCDSWASLVEIYLKAHGLPIPPSTFYNLGARKHSTKKINERFESEFNARNLPEAESYFIIMCGTVDCAAPNGSPVLEQAESLASLEQLLTNAKSKGKCVFLSPPPVANEAHNARIAALSKEQEKLCYKLDVGFVDCHQILTDNVAYIPDLTDGVHPQEMGNAALSDAICQSLSIQEWTEEFNPD